MSEIRSWLLGSSGLSKVFGVEVEWEKVKEEEGGKGRRVQDGWG